MLRLNSVSPVLDILESTIGEIPVAIIQTDSINEEAAEYNPTKALVLKKYKLKRLANKWNQPANWQKNPFSRIDFKLNSFFSSGCLTNLSVEKNDIAKATENEIYKGKT